MRVRPQRIFSHLTYANAMSTLAVVLVVGTGTAYAANTVFSTDIVNGEVKTADLANDGVTSAKILNNSVFSGDVRDDTLANGGLSSVDLAANSVASSEIAEGSIGNSEIAFGAVGTDEIGFGAVGRSDLATIERWHYIGDPGEPAFESGWSNYDSSASHSGATWQHAAYAKDHEGSIHLRGLVKGGTIGQPMFRLPLSYCPWFYHAYGVIANNATSRLTVTYATTDNNCWVYVENGSNAWVSLDNVTFQEYPLEMRATSAQGAAVTEPSTLPGSPPIHGPARIVPKR